MKKLILISALLFSFNSWADDLICSATKYDNWYKTVIKDYKANSGFTYSYDGKIKRDKWLDSDEPPYKSAFERQDRYWWYEYMEYSPRNTDGVFSAYDPETKVMYGFINWTCEIKKTN